MFIFTGCSTTVSKQIPKEKISDKNLGSFVGGLIGLETTLLDGAPPDIIQDEGLTPFSFVMVVENKGEAAVGPGTDNPFAVARISGMNHAHFGLTETTAVQKLDNSLSPMKRNFDGSISSGAFHHFSFENMAYKQNLFNSLTLTLRGEICYDYETLATVKFCVKKDLFENAQDATLCSLRGDLPFGNSAAPLQITKVEEAPVNDNTVQINFVIEHFGSGIFFYRNEPKDLYDACVFEERNPHIYKLEVLVEPVQKNTYDINCLRLEEKLPGGGASGLIRLYKNAPITMTCFVKRTSESSVRVYEDLLNIKLRYRYGEFIEKPVMIRAHP